jgi:hypothetical protein
MNRHEESRRAFLKGAAVGAGAVGVGLVPDALAQSHEQHKTAEAPATTQHMRMAADTAHSSMTTTPPPSRPLQNG